MKKKNLNFLLALLAALALVFAGACSDGSDDSDDTTTGGNGNTPGSTETETTAVTADQVKGILTAIGDAEVATENTTGGEYWKFGSGTWTDATNETPATFTVQPSGSSNTPSIANTLANVKKLETQTATDSSCSINFTSVDWDETAKPTSSNSGSGSITVTVTAGEGYSVPSALQSVTITFDPNSKNWAD